MRQRYWRIFVLPCLWLMHGCGGLPIVEATSENYSDRVDYLVLHFTSETFEDSMRLLTKDSNNPVSSHYLVPEPDDATYDGGALKIYRLVPEPARAWHAGRSYWHGETSLNDRSIGIEIVNLSECHFANPSAMLAPPEDLLCEFLDYSEEQLALVFDLIADIVERYPGLDPVDIIAHSDIATTRRSDPGPQFPWRRLYENGIGAWYDDETAAKYRHMFSEALPRVSLWQKALRGYGYDIAITGIEDVQTRYVTRAFQLHFRPEDYSGRMDTETAAILFALLEKYREDESATLLGELDL